jgi:hypothetical protein
MTAALDAHKAGQPTIVDGAKLSAWIAQFLEAASIAAGSATPAPAIHCPASVDLSADRHGICVVTVDGHDLRREVFIEPVKGLDTRALDTAVDTQKLQGLAQDELNARLRQNGYTPDVVVRCPSGFMTVVAPSTFYCDATAGGKAYKLEVMIEDAAGKARWRMVPPDSINASPSPSPT